MFAHCLYCFMSLCIQRGKQLSIYFAPSVFIYHMHSGTLFGRHVAIVPKQSYSTKVESNLVPGYRLLIWFFMTVRANTCFLASAAFVSYVSCLISARIAALPPLCIIQASGTCGANVFCKPMQNTPWTEIFNGKLNTVKLKSLRGIVHFSNALIGAVWSFKKKKLFFFGPDGLST